MGREEDLAIATVRRCVEQSATTGDLSVVLRPDVLVMAKRLARLRHEDLRIRYLLGWFHWFRYLSLPDGFDRIDLAASGDLLMPCFIAGEYELPAPLAPLLADQAVPTAYAADFPVDLWQRIVANTPTEHPDRFRREAMLGTALHQRFLQTETDADLDDAITHLRLAVELGPAAHPGHLRIVEPDARDRSGPSRGGPARTVHRPQ